jgi:hypothetical protein
VAGTKRGRRGQPLEEVRRTRDEIAHRVDALVAELDQ